MLLGVYVGSNAQFENDEKTQKDKKSHKTKSKKGTDEAFSQPI